MTDSATPLNGVFERFSTVAERYATAAAVSQGAVTLTYGELRDRVDDFASRLRRAGVAEGHLVAVNQSGPDYVVGILAVLSLGAVYLPVDERDTSNRSQQLLAHARPNHIIRSDGVVSHLLDAPVHFTALRGPEFPAYVMYTSGSTGRPKGTIVPHRAVFRLAVDPDWIALGTETRTYAMAPLAFDASTFELWAALLNGGSVVFPASIRLSLPSLMAEVRRCEVRDLWLASGLFSVIVERDVAELRGLRHLITGGDVVSPRHAERAAVALDPCIVMNGYGPTENTTFSTTYRIRPGERLGSSVPIGQPIDGTTIDVLGDDLKPVPRGGTGQLAVGGTGLALGYLHDLALTAERFVRIEITGELRIVYLTGDVVRERDDGQLLFVGRRDDLVKVRGYRVELTEVESALRAHPAVTQAVVLASSGDERKHLIAYVALDSSCEADDLDPFLRSRLPEYMVPAEIIRLEVMPLTPHGKIDKSRLSTVSRDDAAGRRSPEPPTTDLERRIVHVFERILNTHPIGINDGFFDCGGDSLGALELLETLNFLFGVEFDSEQLFAEDTPRALALVLGRASRPRSPLVAIKPTGHRPPFVCVHGGGGEVLFLADVRRYLSHDQPFYALAPPGLNGDEPAPKLVEEFALRYVDAIRAKLGEGPYAIGGLCFGGSIAVETARRLMEARCDVVAVTLFDTIFPTRWRAASEIVRHRARQLVRAAKGSSHTTAGLGSLWRRAAGSAVERNILRAVFWHTPTAFPGRLGLFLGDDARFRERNDPRLGWTTVARDVEVRRVPGTRSSMFSGENARVLAAELEAYLQFTQDSP